MVLVNAVFVALYLSWNWAEYSAINGLGSPIYVTTHFPLYIQYEGAGNAVRIFIDSNFTLLLFLLAIAINMYFLFRLQRSKETKPTNY
jgi:heme O synthase-like polyprenyltransferase